MGSDNAYTDFEEDADLAPKQAGADASLAAEHLKQDASDAADQVKHDAEAAITVAREGVKEVGDEISRQAGSLGEEAKQGIKAVTREAAGIANDQKNLLATQIDGVAEALDKVAAELDEKNEAVAGYVHSAAEKAHELTSAVRDSSIESLLATAQDFGRRQPLLFIGGAALAGLAASRFLTASARRHQSGQS